MMNCNWLIKVAMADRKTLVEKYGYSQGSADAMNHNEIVKELKDLGHDWKAKYVIINKGSMLTWSKKHGWTPNFGSHLSEEEGNSLLGKMNNPSLSLEKVATGPRIG
jgi:hypothetical protein